MFLFLLILNHHATSFKPNKCKNASSDFPSNFFLVFMVVNKQACVGKQMSRVKTTIFGRVFAAYPVCTIFKSGYIRPAVNPSAMRSFVINQQYNLCHASQAASLFSVSFSILNVDSR